MKTNQFELSGFVGNAPELRFTPNGTSVATFSVYTRERWTGGDGAAHEKTQRQRITAWAAQAEFAQQRLVKGTRVQIFGRIDQQSWGEGENRQYKTVLVANEIMIVRSPSDTTEVGEAPAPAADDTAKPAADAATPPAPKRRRMKQAA